MAAETKLCQNCTRPFVIEPEDFAFLERLKVPPPTFCPECRLVRRFAFRNERSLYKRKCDLCGEAKIMMYPEGTRFPVYCKPCWWSDKWDPTTYGKAFDPSRTFFEQFAELLNAVPRPGVIHQGNIVNSDYTNRVTDMRNSYLVFGTTVAENSRYSTWINGSTECLDCYATQKSEQCYECVDCHQCHNVRFSQETSDCTDSWFLYNCRNLQNCFGCVNLRNQQYCIFNEKYPKEEYQRIVQGYQTGNANMLEGIKKKFADFRKKFVVPAIVTYHGTNVSGNWLDNSKNLVRSFMCDNVEEGRYNTAVLGSKDVMDFSYWGAAADRMYESVNIGIQCSDVKFSNECWNQAIALEYCFNCHNAHDLFGCVGVRNGEYMILNRAYKKEEFEKLAGEIRAHMSAHQYKDRGGRTYSYGEFLPIEMSPHAYNETIAQEFFPITKEEAEKLSYRWRDEEGRAYAVTMPAMRIPDAIAEANADIQKEIIGCAHGGTCNQKCTTAFRILTEDVAFYKAHNIPLPKLCPNCRHFERLALRNPLRLWKRACACAGASSENGTYKNGGGVHPSHEKGAHCPNEFETSYEPTRPEIVYCLECYQAEVS